jgi:hypothetical protein
VAADGPVTQTKWSHVPLTFTKANIKLISFPHTNFMVITTHIDKWDVSRVLIDNGSQAEILFLTAFDQMGFNKNQLKETMNSLYGFRGRRVVPIGSISLSVSFGSQQNTQTEQVTFDVVDMHYPYNAIFGIGLLTTFETTLHSVYLCLKVPTPLAAISIHGNQREARNIE